MSFVPSLTEAANGIGFLSILTFLWSISGRVSSLRTKVNDVADDVVLIRTNELQHVAKAEDVKELRQMFIDHLQAKS